MESNYYYYNATSGIGEELIQGLIGTLIAIYAIAIIVSIVILIAMAKIFKKANKPAWYVIIPIVNIYTLFQIAGLPGWQILLMFVPFLNIYITIKLCIELAKAFGKDTAFGIGLFFLNPIFTCILGFGSAQYQLGQSATTQVPPQTGANQNSTQSTQTQPAPAPKVGDDWVNGQQ